MMSVTLSPSSESEPKHGSRLSGDGVGIEDRLIFDFGIANEKINGLMPFSGSGGSKSVFTDDTDQKVAADMGERNGLLFLQARKSCPTMKSSEIPTADETTLCTGLVIATGAYGRPYFSSVFLT